jgi:ribonuclease-3
VQRAASFVERLGLPIRNAALVQQALVHSSWLHEHPDAAAGHNERLEYLGDVVVNLVISEAVYRRHPTDDEGSLSARRAAIVSTVGLARIADRIGLGRALLLGEGEGQRGGRTRPSLLASGFEALVGAIFLDLGWRRTRAWLTRLVEPDLELQLPAGSLKSPKSRLQEFTQRELGTRPAYTLLEAIGPDHEREFTVGVAVAGEVLGRGRGRSRRDAETLAAAAAIEVLVARGLLEPIEAGPADDGDGGPA